MNNKERGTIAYQMALHRVENPQSFTSDILIKTLDDKGLTTLYNDYVEMMEEENQMNEEIYEEMKTLYLESRNSAACSITGISKLSPEEHKKLKRTAIAQLITKYEEAGDEEKVFTLEDIEEDII